jgi:hypothetical protein
MLAGLEFWNDGFCFFDWLFLARILKDCHFFCACTATNLPYNESDHSIRDYFCHTAHIHGPFLFFRSRFASYQTPKKNVWHQLERARASAAFSTVAFLALLLCVSRLMSQMSIPSYLETIRSSGYTAAKSRRVKE